MYQKDYILRLIEQVAKAIAVILGLISKKQYLEALEEAKKAYLNYLNIETSYLDSVPPDNMGEILQKETEMGHHELEIIGKLLKLEGDAFIGQGKNEDARNKYLRGLSILEYINNTKNTEFSIERFQYIQQIRDRLKTMIQS
jgi:hypothetical protein